MSVSCEEGSQDSEGGRWTISAGEGSSQVAADSIDDVTPNISWPELQ